MIDLAERWARHTLYWSQAPILTHTLRYEDLKATPIPQASAYLLTCTAFVTDPGLTIYR